MSSGAPPQTSGRMLAPGDLVYMLHVAGSGWKLGQMPVVQGAFVALDPHDGATVALTGGFDFYASKFNRAVQTRGSRARLSSHLSIRRRWKTDLPWRRSSTTRRSYSTTPSAGDGVATGKLFAQVSWPDPPARGTGQVPEPGFRPHSARHGTRARRSRHIKPFGLPGSALPRDLSLALGSGGASPWDIAAGYATFASGGYRVDHYLIERVLDADEQHRVSEAIAGHRLSKL